MKAILRYEILLTPLMELQLLFEKESTKLIHVFPAILRAFQQYVLISAQPLFATGRRLKATVYTVHQLFKQKVKPPHLYPTPETTLMCIDSLLGLLSSYYANEEYIQQKPILTEGWNKLQSLFNEKERMLINKTLPTEIDYQIIKTHNLTERTTYSFEQRFFIHFL